MPATRSATSPICRDDTLHLEVVSRLAPRVANIDGIGEVLAALSDDTRLKILFALSQAELCVCDVAAVAGVTKAVASYHLRLLYRLGLADFRKAGRQVFYRLSSHEIEPLLRAVLDYATTGRGAGADRDDEGAGR